MMVDAPTATLRSRSVCGQLPALVRDVQDAIRDDGRAAAAILLPDDLKARSAGGIDRQLEAGDPAGIGHECPGAAIRRVDPDSGSGQDLTALGDADRLADLTARMPGFAL